MRCILENLGKPKMAKELNLMTCNELFHLRKPVKHNKNRVSTFIDLGKPKIKFIEISTQGLIDTGNDVYSLCSCTLDFFFLYAMHYSHIHYISILILYQ